MEEIKQDDYRNNLDLLNFENNPFSLKEIPSLNKKNFGLLNTANHNSTRNHKNIILKNARKSFDNLLNNIPQKKLKRFNTQKNVKTINYINTIPKFSSNIENDFILAKKNNLYENNKNNNGQMNILNNNNNLESNEDIFAKKIKSKLNKNFRQVKNYKIIINKNENYKPNIYYINGNNNNLNNNIEKKILDKFNENNIHIRKKISNDKLNNFDMNLTTPNSYDSYIKGKEFKSENLTEKKNLNQNIDNKNLLKLKKGKIFKNIKFMNQKRPKMGNNKNITQKQYSESKSKILNRFNQMKNDLSFSYGTNINEKLNNVNNYRKFKSGIAHYNFLSEKKVSTTNNNNIDDVSDEEIDEIVGYLDIYIENEDKRNKTFIENEPKLLNESIDLSDLADDMMKLLPEQESDDINKQSTVPSTSNHESDAIYDGSNNNVNMNNIKINIPLNASKIKNTRPAIVNNFYTSSSEINNKSNKNENNINYNLFVVNEYNNTNNDTNNNIKNDIYENNSSISKLINKTYKSPFIIGNMKNKINSSDINEIEGSEKNMEFNEIKKNNQKIDIINLNLNYSNNININNKNIYNTEIKPNLNKMNNQTNNNLNSNIKKNSTKNIKERKFSDSILRDLLSSHKNTPSINNNIQMSDKNNLINITNNNIDNENNNFDEIVFFDENMIPNELKKKNKYLYKNNKDSKKIINNPIKKFSPKKKKKHISFNLDNNIYIIFGSEDLITNSQVTDKNGQIFEHIEKNMIIYNEELKRIKPKSIIKKFSSNEIGINKEYIFVENLQEKQILPDLYDEFEEQDIKSLEKCLEKSVDKI